MSTETPTPPRAQTPGGDDAVEVCRMVDDFARLPPAALREQYGVATLGALWDRIKAAAHRAVLAHGQGHDGHPQL